MDDEISASDDAQPTVEASQPDGSLQTGTTEEDLGEGAVSESTYVVRAASSQDERELPSEETEQLSYQGDLEEEINVTSTEVQEVEQTYSDKLAAEDVSLDIQQDGASEADEISSGKVSDVETKDSLDVEATKLEGDMEDLSLSAFFKQYLPWFSIAIVGLLLLLVSIILLVSGVTRRQTFSLKDVNVPSLQASMRIYSVGGEELRYSKQLKFIGNLQARELRRKIEPKLQTIYEAAGLDVDAVLILSFTYGEGGEFDDEGSGAAGETSTNRARRFNGRIAKSSGRSLLTRHWVYLNENVTKYDLNELLKNVKKAATDEEGIEIDTTSITLIDLTNITQVQAISVLSQHGFFKNGINNLDFELLATIGLVRGPSDIGLQSGDDGLCPGFKKTSNIMVSPSTCQDSSNTYLGMVCTFQCRSPLYLAGSSSRVCLSSGHWSGSPAMCKAKCPPIKLNTAGSLLPLACSSSNVSAGRLCFIQCPSTHQLYSEDNIMIVGSSYFKQCMDDGTWTGGLVFCKAKCRPLNVPYNYNITMNSCAWSAIAGDICTLTCNDDFVLDGGGTSQQLSCDSNGKWNKELLQCKKLCIPITLSSNQAVEPESCRTNPYEGLKCTFSCAQGYKLDNSNVRFCSSDGWGDVQPACVASCSKLNTISHGIYVSILGDCNKNMPAAGTTCRLHCDAGYTPTTSQVLCDAAIGNWSDYNLKCQRACDILPDAPSGYWQPLSCTTQTSFRQCTLTCDIEFQLVGDAVLNCDVNTGKWDKKPGRCDRSCPPLSSPINGNLPFGSCTTTPTEGTRCEFTCVPGFGLNRDNVLRCQSNGQWTSLPPSCVADEQYLIQTVYSDPPLCLSVEFQYWYSHAEEGHYVPVMSSNCSTSLVQNQWSIVWSTKIRSAFTGTCLTGYLTDRSIQLRPCTLSSNDAGEDNFVGGQQYQILHNSTNMYISFGLSTSLLHLISYATLFSPTSAFKLIDRFSVESSFFGLDAGSCAALVDSPNMQIPGNCLTRRADLSQCTLSCDSGYQLANGDANIQLTCSNGVWNNLTELVECVASDGCTTYPDRLMEGGVVLSCTENKVAHGKSCVFSCPNEDDYVDGPSSIYCNRESRWSSYSVVTCRSHCSYRYVHRNTMLSSMRSASCSRHGTAKVGDVCQFKCNDGFDLEGNQLSSCRDSYFSSSEPSCTQACKPFDEETVLSYSGCTAAGLPEPFPYSSVTSCSVNCAPGYVISNSKLTCVAGVWNVPEGCTAACPALTTPAPGSVFPSGCASSSSLIGTSCYVICQENGTYISLGGALVKSMQRTCSSDSLWDGPFTYCSKFCPPLSASLAGANGYFWPASCVGSPQRPGYVCHLKCQGLSNVYGGDSMLKCTMEGEWETLTSNQQLGSCLRSCASLYQPLYSVISPHHCAEGQVPPGTECIVECPPNMERQGPGAFRCLGTISTTLATGLWSSSESTRCLAKCPPLPRLPSTLIFPQDCVNHYKLDGDYCSFECERGLTLSGTLALQCLENGEWSEEIPICQRTCIGVQIFNGRMTCAGLPYDASVGFDHFPGTRCTFICDEGYTALSHNEVTCTQQGLWSPDPYCKRETSSFTIFQKIKEESKCLSVTWNNANVGSDWILSFISSASGCVAAGNNAMWHWHGLNNLKHVQSGLCIAAERAKRESLLVLELCDIDNSLQQWDCDSWRSSRVLLKGTDLSIDTTYKGLGPVLETWTHALAYWLTFNEELETTASLCSFRPVGTCPGINIPNIVVSPDVCSGDEILVWQKCELSCKADSYSAGTVPLPSTECLPTGAWKDIEEVQCVKKCPPLPNVSGKTYSPASCGTGDMDHHSQCSVSCKDGFRLSNNESSVTLLCDDGRWDGPSVECVCAPTPPENGVVTCINETCDFMCNPGFKLSSGSQNQISCNVGASAFASVSCTADKQFMICSDQVSGVDISSLCLTVADSTTTETRKAMENVEDKSLFWRWRDQKLQHALTGMCVSSSSRNDWSELMVANCDGGGVLTFDCNNHLNSRVIRVSSSNMYVGFGGVSINTPAVLVNTTSVRMVEWYGSSTGETRGSICVFKTKGQCPKLAVSEYTAINPSTCEEESTVGTSCDITCTGSARFLNTVSNQFSSDTSMSVTCSSLGEWTKTGYEVLPSIMPCTSSAIGSCPTFTLTNGLMVEPPKCMSGDTVATGFQCFFTCQSGFYMIGQAVTLCKSSWTNSMPSCERYCPLLTVKKNTKVSPPACLGATSRQGASCTFSCMVGYTTSTPSMSVTTECQKDGKWSDVTITCKKTCTLLSSTKHGVTVNTNAITSGTMKVLTSPACVSSVQVEGSMCSFSCPPSYVLVDGGSQSTCKYGEWSGKIGRCIKEFFCPEASSAGTESVVYEAKYAGQAVAPGTAVYITCMEGYVVDGDNERLCEESGSWGGRGPATPACLRMCPPLPKKFRTLITPPECTSGYSANGVSCTATCQSNTKYSDGSRIFSVTCNNGVWSNSLKSCVYAITDAQSDGVYREFMIVTRNPEPGCFYPDDGDVVRWKSMLECNATEQINKWAWTDQRGVLNLGATKCLQAIQVNNNIGILGVAACNGSSSQLFSCGNPKSAMEWSMFYFDGGAIWEMAFTTNAYTGRIASIDMYQVSTNFQRYSKQNFAALQLRATQDILFEASIDDSVCSYMCGGRILREPTNGYISSPGFLKGLQYPAYSSCKWTIVAYRKLIQLNLLELNLEGTAMSKSPCEKDCIQVFEGLDSNPPSSDHLMTFTGSDLEMYSRHGKHELSTVAGYLFVHFISDHQNNQKGFVFKYMIATTSIRGTPTIGSRSTVRCSAVKIKDIPTSSGCGVSMEQWTVPPEDDEPPLGGRPHITKWPWLVSIRQRAERKGRAYHRCTGVLVDATTVISAAHCANFAITALIMDQGVTMGVGQTSQFAMDDDLAMGRVTEAHRVFIHPDYNPDTRENDIAVWKLRNSTSYNGSVPSVCMPTAGYAMHHTATPCYAVGWTQLDNGISVRRIVEYRMRVEPTSFCELMFGLQANSGFICAVLDRLDNTVAAGTDDSEPLICFSDIDKWYVVGVASHTRVSRYMTRRLYTSVHANAAWLRLTIDRTAIVSPRSRGLELLDQALLDLMEADSSGERQEGESGSGEES